MKRKIPLILASILGVGILAVALLIWNINPLLESFRPRITSFISSAIKQPVVLGKIEAKIFPSTGIAVSDVRLQGSDGSGSDGVKSLMLYTSFGQLISGNISVDTLEIEDATITAIKEVDGSMTVAGVSLGAKKQNSKKQGAKDQLSNDDSELAKNTSGSESSDDQKGSLAFEIQNANISNVNINFIDRSVSPAQNISLDNIGAEIKNIGTKEKGSFKLTASLLGTEANNIELSGSMNLGNLSPAEISGDVALELRKLDLKKIMQIANAYGTKIENLSLSESLSISLSAKTIGGGVNLNAAVNADGANIIFGQQFVKPAGETLTLTTSVVASLLGDLNADKAELRLGEIVLNFPFRRQNSGALSLKVQSEKLKLAELGKFVPSVRDFALGGFLSSDINATIKPEAGSIPELSGSLTLTEVAATVPGESPMTISNVNGPIVIENGVLSIKGLKLNVKNQPLTVGAKISKLPNPDSAVLALGAFGGNAVLQTSLPTETSKGIAATLSGSKMNVESLGALAMSKSPITGTLDDLNAKVTLNSEKPTETLSGPARVSITEGEIIGFNLLGSTLGKISNIPGVGGSLASFVPEEHRALLEAGSTAFSLLHGEVNFVPSRIELSTVELRHPLYIVLGRGELGFNGDMKIKGEMKLTPALCTDMILKEPKLKLLSDREGNITFPIVIEKDAGKTRVLPDISSLLKRAAGNTAKEAAGRALDRVAPGLGGALDSLW